MKLYVHLQLFKSFKKVNFYTFKFEDELHTETEKFFNKFENDVFVLNDLNNMVAWLTLIGEKYGAKTPFFRHEAAAHALPPPMSKMIKEVIVNDLRLYCVWISEEIVILANGGIKQSQKVQDSDDLLPHFRFANIMAKQIDELIRNKEFHFNKKQIQNLSEIELIY